MNVKVVGYRAGTRDDLAEVQQRRALLHGELVRVREAALAWRNGAAAGVAGIMSFGLIRGRTDVASLSWQYSILAGVLLLLALAAGVSSAYLFLRAAHGELIEVPVSSSGLLWERGESKASIRAVRRGRMILVLAICFLVAGVAVTWYAPTPAAPNIQVTTDSGTLCVYRLERSPKQNALSVITADGTHEIPVTELKGVSASTGGCSLN